MLPGGALLSVQPLPLATLMSVARRSRHAAAHTTERSPGTSHELPLAASTPGSCSSCASCATAPGCRIMSSSSMSTYLVRGQGGTVARGRARLHLEQGYGAGVSERAYGVGAGLQWPGHALSALGDALDGVDEVVQLLRGAHREPRHQHAHPVRGQPAV